MRALLAVNFHYVQPLGAYPYPGIHPTPPEQLERQLLALRACAEFVSGDQLAQAVTDGAPLPQRGCVVTFDDGLREHEEHALPILKRLEIPAIFFVCTQPLLERKALTVHKTHWLQATRPPAAFLALLRECAESLGVSIDLDDIDDAAAARQYLYDQAPIRRLKFLLNHVMARDSCERLIDAMFRSEMDDAEFCARWYMDAAALARLSTHVAIGSHAHSHCALAAMAPRAMTDELDRSKRMIERITGRRVDLVSYPYGGATALSPAVAQAAQACGYVAGFTMERALNRTLQQPLVLARVSTNDAPGGAAPLLSVEAGAWSVQPPMQAHRALEQAQEQVGAAAARGDG